jgi:hypothetical protein
MVGRIRFRHDQRMPAAPAPHPLSPPDRTQRIDIDSLRTEMEAETPGKGAKSTLPPPASPGLPNPTNTNATNRRSGGAPIAAWLATIGAALVLVAAVAATPGGWAGLSPAIKLAVLAAANVVVLSLTERLRKVVPVTARVLGHLGPSLAVPTGILAAASLQQRWPVAILAGGLLGAGATEAQRRRLTLPLLRIGSTIALLVAVAGIAALAHAPAGVIAAALAVALLLGRRPLEAAAAAIVALAAPTGALLGQAGVGPGTMVVLGIRGNLLTWAAPVAGIVAGSVLLVVSHRRRSTTLALTAAAGVVVNTLVGLGTLDVRTAWWSIVPGAIALLIEGFARAGEGADFWSPVTGWLAEALEVGAVACLVPIAAVTAFALAEPGSFHMQDRPTIAVGLGLVALALLVAVGRKTHRVLVAPFLTATAVGYAALCAIVAANTYEAFGITACFGALAFVALHPRLAARAWIVAAVPAIAVITQTYSSAWCVVTSFAGIALLGASALIERRRGSARATIARSFALAFASAVPAVAPFVVASLQGNLRLVVVGLVLAACAATGLAFSVRSVTMLDALAFSASGAALLTALSISELGLVSLAAIILGGELALYGLARKEQPMAIGGAVLGGVGLLSSPFTTGAYDWLTRTLGAHGITVADMNITAIVLALLVGGFFVRKLGTASSWLAFGPGLAVATVHLIATVAESHQPARAGVAIGIGVVALLVGGLRKLAAPLFIGTGLVVGPTLIMAGPSLAKLSMWLWVALGGAVLIAAAIVIERTVRGDDEATGSAKRTWSTLK